MGKTKMEKISPDQLIFAGTFKALAHPARINILDILKKSEYCICKDFVSKLGLGQGTVSQHLSELKKSRLIKTMLNKRSECYCINQKTREKYMRLTHDFLDSITSKPKIPIHEGSTAKIYC